MKGDAYHAQVHTFRYDYEEHAHVEYTTQPYNEIDIKHFNSDEGPSKFEYVIRIKLQQGAYGWSACLWHWTLDHQRIDETKLEKLGQTPHDSLVNLIEELNFQHTSESIRSEGIRFIVRCFGAIQPLDKVLKSLENI